VQRWERIDQALVPDGDDRLELWRRGDEFSIRLQRGGELMNSRTFGSERALAAEGLHGLDAATTACVLIGGLGLGHTLAAALAGLGPQAAVEVAELSAAVTAWNRGPLAHLAGAPLNDARVVVHNGDVGARIAATPGRWDAILLDVDNGPDGLSRAGNDALYGDPGLRRARQALRPGGRLAVWSAHPSPAFRRRFGAAGFAVREVVARARGGAGGARHRIWIGVRRAD
jgi:spermidine synthase